jgi:uncharacterized protein DUF4411
VYCLDTSALFDGWVRYYPPATFRTLWEDRLEGLIEGGRLISSKSVLHEIDDREDRCLEWATNHADMFKEDDEEIQARVRALLADWPHEVDFTRFFTGADPFVVAHAQQNGFKVVTGERQVRSMNAPKIPDVCQHYGIPWCSLLGMIQEQGWQF